MNDRGRVVQCKWGFVYLTVEQRIVEGYIVDRVHVTAKAYSERQETFGYYGMLILDDPDAELCRKFRIW